MKPFNPKHSGGLALALLVFLNSTPGLAAGKPFNPDISANFLGLYRNGTGLSNDLTDPDRNGFTLQEAELQLFSDVDVYFRATALFSIAQKPGSKDFGIDPEEVYFETISLPVVTLRAGKMKLALGKHNQLHTHAFPFIDAPLINTQLLGDEGLNEIGVSAAALLPTHWFSEFTLQGYSPTNDTLFSSGGVDTKGSAVGVVAHWKNLVDLNDDTTMELGASGTTAKNAVEKNSSVVGGDFTLKWRPAEGGKYKAFIFATEYLNGMNTNRLSGLASWAQYQFAERWWVQGRGEYLGLQHATSVPAKNKQSVLLGFFPSEFSGFRVQGDHEKNLATHKDDYTASIQYNVTIGAHPAHSY